MRSTILSNGGTMRRMATSRARMIRSCGSSLLLAAALSLSHIAHAKMTLPVPLDDTIVEWPAEHARAEDLFVPVTLVVSSIGNVTSAAIEQNVGEPFDSAVLASARKLRFTPGHDERGARAARIRVLMRFLANASAPLSASSSATATPAEPPPAAPAATSSAEAAEPIAATALDSAAPPGAPREITVLGTPPPRSASETLISGQWLRAAPHKNSSELLRVVPGVFVSQHSGEGKAHQIFFRGYDAVHGQDVELWAGGAPINDVSNIHGQGYADLHFLIPEVVRTIHSTPGTYDPRQGDFAIAGSLRFELGYDEPGLTVKGSLGSFGARRYFMAYRPRTANADSFGAFELRSTDGFGPSRAARHASAITQAYFATDPCAPKPPPVLGLGGRKVPGQNRAPPGTSSCPIVWATYAGALKSGC